MKGYNMSNKKAKEIHTKFLLSYDGYKIDGLSELKISSLKTEWINKFISKIQDNPNKNQVAAFFRLSPMSDALTYILSNKYKISAKILTDDRKKKALLLDVVCELLDI